MQRLLPFLCCLLLAACAGRQGGPAEGDPPSFTTGTSSTTGTTTGTTTGPTTSAPTTSATGGTIVLTQDWDFTGGLYVEGSVSFVKVTDADGVVVEQRLQHDRFRHDLPAGDYTVTSYQRPCDGNCGYLDPPTDRCSHHVTVAGGELLQVHLTVRPGSGCDFDEPPATPSA
jgi:hypothetical protein